MSILKSKTHSPFGHYYVEHYFKRIEFQHRGSPHAHILLWLHNAPQDPLNNDLNSSISLIDNKISVSKDDASGQIKHQTHKHTFTCYKNIVHNGPQKCRFHAPFMPSKQTLILKRMPKENSNYSHLRKHYSEIQSNLENNDYSDIQTFYEHNNITSDEHYITLLQAGIDRPRVFLKRQPTEKWHNNFNPFIFSILNSNMDIQLITEEYSCAGMAWFLLREPMSKASAKIEYIPTVWPANRHKIRKTNSELNAMQIGEDSTDIWKENWFTKYQQRPANLENISLAEFVANYNIKRDSTTTLRSHPRIIRYRNYDMSINLLEYKRVLVTLHIPFRDEESELLTQTKFVSIYDEKELFILNARQKFE